MKRIFIAAALAAAALAAMPGHAADVGVSISVGDPGFYGRIDIGDFPRPRVLYRQPVYVERVAVQRAPIYLRVPPGHARHWRRHCAEYHACGERVYFVRNDWYEREYVPRYKARHRSHDGYDGRRGDNHGGDRRGDGNGRGPSNHGDQGDRGRGY